jgi:uncharacterized protein YndB with AHSA1/START domain
MFQIEKSITIARPIGDVFAFVADQRNAPEWQIGLLEVRRTTEAPLGVGSKHVVVRKLMGRRIEATNEYVRFEPDKVVTFKGDSGPMHFEFSYLTEPSPEGTRLTGHMEMQSGGLWGLAEPLLASSVRREMEANLPALKELMESRVAEPASPSN